jgi:flavin-dependent dehydrogenase
MVEQAKKAEAELRDETTVKKIKRRENAIELESGEEIGYSTLIGADGANSVVRKALGLTSKSMDAAEIRVDIPPAEIKNGGKDKAHSYWSADVFGHGYFGYVPFKDHVEFGLFSFDNEFFTFAEKIKRVKRFVKETDEIDLEQYKTKAWKICYGYVGMKHDNIYLIGDAGGFGTINAGEIYVAAESGKLAAKDILGQSIKDEMDDLMEWRKGWNSIDLLLSYYRFLPGAVKRRVTRMVMDHGAPFVFNHKIVLDIGYYFLNKKLFEGGPR